MAMSAKQAEKEYLKARGAALMTMVHLPMADRAIIAMRVGQSLLEAAQAMDLAAMKDRDDHDTRCYCSQPGSVGCQWR